MWYETVTKRGVSEIGSSLLIYIKNCVDIGFLFIQRTALVRIEINKSGEYLQFKNSPT